jgi:hypothetical protein
MNDFLINRINIFTLKKNVKSKGISFRVFALRENKTELSNEKQT